MLFMVMVLSFRWKSKRMEVLMRAPGSQFPMWGGAGPRFSEAGPRSVHSFQGPDSARLVRGQYTAFRVQIQQGWLALGGPRFSEAGPRSVYSFQGPDLARLISSRAQVQRGRSEVSTAFRVQSD
jgi:hypothetical protein